MQREKKRATYDQYKCCLFVAESESGDDESVLDVLHVW